MKITFKKTFEKLIIIIINYDNLEVTDQLWTDSDRIKRSQQVKSK